MILSKLQMLDILKKQLAIDLNCQAENFDQPGIFFCEAKLNEGRRLFQRQSPYLELVTLGKGVVVSCDQAILPKVKSILTNKSREDLFVAPLIYCHSIYYLPDPTRINKIPYPDDFEIQLVEGKAIHELYKIPGFYNAIQYDPHHPRPDVIALVAKYEHQLVAIAGASEDSKTMWQIGIDVLPPFRNKGLATSLVTHLALIIMERGIVPYYGAASSNIASLAVAFKSGLIPTWMSSYKNRFDDSFPYKNNLFEN